jgi:hypothetical protein
MPNVTKEPIHSRVHENRIEAVANLWLFPAELVAAEQYEYRPELALIPCFDGTPMPVVSFPLILDSSCST